MLSIRRSIFFLIAALSCMSLNAYENSVKFRVGGFYHTSQLFREIYDSWGVCYEVEGTACVWRCIDAWANFDWFGDHGGSVPLRNNTRVRIANVSFGLKYGYPFNCRFMGYLGLGPSFSNIRVDNDGTCRHGRESQWAYGGVLKTGVYYLISPCVFLDLFADFLYQPVRFRHRHTEIGGIKVGLGIGRRF